MKKEYPENIQQIDGFYKDHLDNLEMEPALSWEKLNAAIAPVREQTIIARSRAFYLKLSIALNIMLIALLGYVFFASSGDSKPGAAEGTVKTVVIQPSSETIGEKAQDPTPKLIKTPVGEQKKVRATSSETPSVNTINETASEIQDTKAQHLNSGEEVTESVQEEKPAVEEKEEEEKEQSFYDKYSKQKKDSLQKLFVPVK